MVFSASKAFCDVSEKINQVRHSGRNRRGSTNTCREDETKDLTRLPLAGLIDG